MSDKPDSWLPLYIADYVADTKRFSTEQHGAYLLIIMDYWRNGPPPDDDRVLAQIAGLALARWKAHRVIIAPKFQIGHGVWKHKRIEVELTKARAMQEVLSKRGKAGAAARWPKDDSGNATGNATGTGQAIPEGMPDTMLADAPSPSPSPESLPPPSPAHSPPQAANARGAMSKALRDQGITGVTPSTPELDAWVTAGISTATVLEAVTLARDKKPAPQPIPFGYIVPIVEQLTTPAKPRVNGHANGRPWFLTWSSIVAKGAEKGINETDFDSPPAFKVAVFRAHEITSDQVQKAERDWA